MTKRISELSLEELWQLFPIILTPHKDVWKEWYQEELALLKDALPTRTLARISHVGSTSLNTIWSKPIIDILVEILPECKLNDVKDLLLEEGYLLMSDNKERISLNKGYTENGFSERVYHLHLRYAGDNDELYFRDYLKENLEVARQYERLKMRLWKEYEHNRDAYTEEKTDFIIEFTQKARREYGTRY